MCNTNEAFAAAQRLVNLVKEAGYNIFDYHEIEDMVRADRRFFPEGMQVEWGASRAVVYDDYCDYVIKIARDECFEKYNQHEVEIYAAAVEEGYEEHFGWCECYIEPQDGCPGIYVMEYLYGDSDEVSEKVYEYGYENYCLTCGLDNGSYESYESYNEERYGDDEEELMEYFESTINPVFVEAFHMFLNRWAITDLHNGNMLFRNGKIVICDYAGWGW